MPNNGQKLMRILVFFDLPTVTKTDKKCYQVFRRFLIRDGYGMLQLSVYSRICNGADNADKHILRLANNIPAKGSVRSICITDKQYARMQHWAGKPTAAEKILKSQQLVLI